MADPAVRPAGVMPTRYQVERRLGKDGMTLMSERKQINFTIVPDESSDEPRTYANFCSISHTPFDFTLTFCEVLPPSERAVREAATDRVLKAPVRSRIVVPMGFVPNLIKALQDHLRTCSEPGGSPDWNKPAVH